MESLQFLLAADCFYFVKEPFEWKIGLTLWQPLVLSPRTWGEDGFVGLFCRSLVTCKGKLEQLNFAQVGFN